MSESHLSAKLVPTFADQGCHHVIKKSKYEVVLTDTKMIRLVKTVSEIEINVFEKEAKIQAHFLPCS
jgi:hypothetical protein